jgi:hypothetical protein
MKPAFLSPVELAAKYMKLVRTNGPVAIDAVAFAREDGTMVEVVYEITELLPEVTAMNVDAIYVEYEARWDLAGAASVLAMDAFASELSKVRSTVTRPR